MSTLHVNNLTTASGSTITVPAGKNLTAPGHVVQVQQFYRPATLGVTTSGTSMVASGYSKAITPKFANSLIIVQASISMAYAAGWGEARMYMNGVVMPTGANYHFGYTDVNHNAYAPLIFQGQHQATSLSTLTFEIYFRGDGSNNYSVSHANASAAITLSEIAQ